MTIRFADKADCAAITEIYNHAVLHTAAIWNDRTVDTDISGYQNVGAATTIAVLVASQLIGGLALDIARSHGVTLRAMVGPAFGALLLVIGAWLIAKRQF
ncbi:hypothetical protein DTU32_00410 [Salmonella enterica subsp. enterica serovar Sendai]|nr:hypothetical protein [Salmonella enterica subsp. enterica serovar Sendai]ECE7319106.1 hypothetical protein [Salmonella enterica subsp. enterica serovar Paratyphi A]SUE51772.1 membrane protein [Salmonella enterica subsp. enterica serovar Sendai]HAC6684086.1 hypothetical protein [Salmonella enterica subsp. enterica serovar Sendai]HAE8722390.1 hypothetical protein [Salmonella enterica subsp. enterica serovar Sendai]